VYLTHDYESNRPSIHVSAYPVIAVAVESTNQDLLRLAAARKLGIRLWIMLRDQIDYTEFCRGVLTSSAD